VHGETGLLVPPGDAVALCQAIEQLLANPELRERMGQAGQCRQREFQAITVVPQVESVYASLLKDNMKPTLRPIG
jgi:glycosyltransferase involved in cell wall biosynthesis